MYQKYSHAYTRLTAGSYVLQQSLQRGLGYMLSVRSTDHFGDLHTCKYSQICYSVHMIDILIAVAVCFVPYAVIVPLLILWNNEVPPDNSKHTVDTVSKFAERVNKSNS